MKRKAKISEGLRQWVFDETKRIQQTLPAEQQHEALRDVARNLARRAAAQNGLRDPAEVERLEKEVEDDVVACWDQRFGHGPGVTNA
jgi:hypothetical protein